jgi:hypothetical protein
MNFINRGYATARSNFEKSYRKIFRCNLFGPQKLWYYALLRCRVAVLLSTLILLLAF